MKPLRIGSVCSGYGGLDLGLMEVVGGSVAWHVEFDSNPSAILETRFPGVPNYGDIKSVNWHDVEPVDWFTAGYPCQPFSNAGKRLGEKDPRHLWPYIAKAIGVLQPNHVLLENVRGHLSKGFGTVLGDLACLGYDARWCVVRASDAGAPHRRERVFVWASTVDAHSATCGQRRQSTPRQEESWRAWSDSCGPCGACPHTASALAANADSTLQSRLPFGAAPTQPFAGGCGCTSTDTSSQRHGSAEISPRVPLLERGDETETRERQWSRQESGDRSSDYCWGEYADAIHRWEQLTRPAPAPTEPTGRDGAQRLSPRFTEWMMGLPDGWVTDILPRNPALKALGNGVVPQQAALALQVLGVGAC